MQHNQNCICVLLPKVSKASSVSTVILAVFAEMPVTIIVATLNILALATLIDAAILGLALFVLHWPRYARQVQ